LSGSAEEESLDRCSGCQRTPTATAHNHYDKNKKTREVWDQFLVQKLNNLVNKQTNDNKIEC